MENLASVHFSSYGAFYKFSTINEQGHAAKNRTQNEILDNKHESLDTTYKFWKVKLSHITKIFYSFLSIIKFVKYLAKSLAIT